MPKSLFGRLQHWIHTGQRMHQLSYCSKTVFTGDDKQLIKSLRQLKGYSSRRFLKEFPQKNWTRRGLYYLLSNTDKYGTAVPSSGRPCTARTSGNTILKVDTINVKQVTVFQWFCGLTMIFWADACATQYEFIVVNGQTTISAFHKVV